MGTNMTASASADSSQQASFFVYILRCADGSLYVGHTSDVETRVKKHNAGRGAQWTACRRPVTLLYKEQHPTDLQAITRERQLKRWTRAKKLALIHNNRPVLQSLAKRQLH
jgi:predicted GIY-YIG superfamily endonuclease